MDGRLPAQFCCSLQVAARQGLIPLRGQAAVVNPVLLARPLQRPVCFPPPDLPGLCNPVFVHHRPALLGTAALRLLSVCPLEPLLGAALDAVVGPLTDYQVRVGILPGFPAPVDGERIGKPLRAGQLLGEATGQVAALPLVQLHGQRHFYLLEQPPVGALVLVCRLPVFAGIVFRPSWHVAALFVFQFFGLLRGNGLRAQGNQTWRWPIGRRRECRFSRPSERWPRAALVLSVAPRISQRYAKVRPSLSFGSDPYRPFAVACYKTAR